MPPECPPVPAQGRNSDRNWRLDSPPCKLLKTLIEGRTSPELYSDMVDRPARLKPLQGSGKTKMKISREDVLRVAELAHLGLSTEEVEKFQTQLDGILNYIDKLNQLDVSQVEPM